MIHQYKAKIEVGDYGSGYEAYVDLRCNGDKHSSLQVDVPLRLEENGSIRPNIDKATYHVGGDAFEYSVKTGLVGVLNTMFESAQNTLMLALKRSSKFSRTVVFKADDGRACCAEPRSGIRFSKSSRISSVGIRKNKPTSC